MLTLFELENPGAFYDYLREKRIPFPEGKEDSLKYSLVRMDRNKNIRGCLLLQKDPEGDIRLLYLSNDGSPGGIMEIFLAFKENEGAAESPI